MSVNFKTIHDAINDQDASSGQDKSWVHSWSDSCGCGAIMCVPRIAEGADSDSIQGASPSAAATTQDQSYDCCGCGASLCHAR